MRPLFTKRAAQIAAKFRDQPGKRELFAKFYSRAEGADTGELWVYEVIGEDWWTGGGVTANRVKSALEAMAGVKTLNIFINSEGGDLFEAKAIHTLLRRFEGQKVVHIDGLAASAATLLAMAGDVVKMAPVATFMIHEAWTIAMGPADRFRAVADLLDLENGILAETYAKKTGDSVDAMRELMKAETWMSATEALEAGFADSIIDDPKPGEEPPAEEAKASSARFIAASQSLERRIAALKQPSRGQQLLAASQRPPGSPGNQR